MPHPLSFPGSFVFGAQSTPNAATAARHAPARTQVSCLQTCAKVWRIPALVVVLELLEGVREDLPKADLLHVEEQVGAQQTLVLAGLLPTPIAKPSVRVIVRSWC